MPNNPGFVLAYGYFGVVRLALDALNGHRTTALRKIRITNDVGDELPVVTVGDARKFTFYEGDGELLFEARPVGSLCDMAADGHITDGELHRDILDFNEALHDLLEDELGDEYREWTIECDA